MAQTYTVKSGDNLSTIASRYGVKVSDISGYKSGNPNLIYPNEVLTIGGGAPAKGTYTSLPQVQTQLNQVANTAYTANSGGSSFDRGANKGYIGGRQYTDYNEYLRDGGMNMDAANNAMPKVRSLTEITTEIKGLLPTEPAPTPPKLLETYEAERQKRGLDALEGDINLLTSEERDLMATKRIRTAEERDKPVAQNIIEGRVSQVERQQNERIDVVQREKAYLVDQAKTAYSAIDTIVNLTGKDYELAKGAYDTKFNQALQIINLGYDIQGQEKTDLQRVQDNARANLTVYADLVKSGNLSVGSLPAEAQTAIAKLEVQSGLGMGFLSKIQGTPISITTREDNGVKYADVITRDPATGQMRVESQVVGSVSTAGSANSIKTTSGVTVTPAQLVGYTKTALEVLAAVDKSYQTIGGKLTALNANDQPVSGDKRLSAAEANYALQKVMDKIGDSEIAAAAYKNAVTQGGYSAWGG